MKTRLKKILPEFIQTYPTTTREIVLSTPQVRPNSLTLIKLSHEEAVMTVRFWDSCDVYAVAVPRNGVKELSEQVVEGTDTDNQAVPPQHHIRTTANS